MLKKAYQKILITAILLVTVLSMLGMAVAAAVINEYTVTFVYDDALCKSLIFKVDGVVIQPIENGSKEYRVDSQHGTVTVEMEHFCPVAFCVEQQSGPAQTGDEKGNQMTLWIVLLVVSLLANLGLLAYLFLRMKKKKK